MMLSLFLFCVADLRIFQYRKPTNLRSYSDKTPAATLARVCASDAFCHFTLSESFRFVSRRILVECTADVSAITACFRTLMNLTGVNELLRAAGLLAPNIYESGQ